MIKISRLADYAVVILAVMAEERNTLMTASNISEKTTLPEPTAAKILKLLVRGKVIHSVRGAGGGYKLSRSPSDIRVSDIIVSVDGPIALTACVEESGEGCGYECSCPVKGRWDDVNAALCAALEEVTLAAMLRNVESKCAKFSFLEEEGLSDGCV